MSKRKAKRRLDKWHRYFRKYEPWHDCTPGILRAYNRWAHAYYAKIKGEDES